MNFRLKRGMNRAGMIALAMGLLMGTATLPADAMTDHYTEVKALDTDGKIAQEVMPRGANMDEVVEVIVQFKGDPVLKEYINEKANGQKLSKNSQKNHANKLVNDKKRAKDKITKDNGKIITSYEKIYNGLFIQAKRSTLNELAELSEVKAIYPVNPVELHNDTSVDFIGAPQVWEKTVDGVNVTGEGITVAVIDTGIDYTHAAFGGEGTTEAYDSNNPNVIEDGSFPTAKVIGGYDFVGTDYDAGSEDPAKRVPMPDADPLDEQGHGSHVGATVAGQEVEGNIGKGVAPDALLYAYKVFGKSGSTGVTTQALEMAADPNGDGDVSDHVDVVNMSLGSSYGHPNDPTAVATNLAVDAGIIVVASAGNSGNGPYITGSPAVAEKAISVAASVDDGVVVGGYNVNSPESIAGQYEAVEGAITTPLSEAGPVTNDVVYVGRACNGDELAGDPTDKIALLDRGTCAFTEKLKNVLNGGATAAVVVNNSAGDPITMGGDPVDIPGVMISQVNGNLLKGALKNGETVNLTLSDEIKIPKPQLADTIASFSSKGPGRGDGSFKPEISAPGFDIRSAAFGTGDAGTLMSGTSMAAPHIAGVAALLRQVHPDWSTEEIKSLIMNTSTPIQNLSEEVYPLSRQGAGRVQVAEAAEATTVAYPQAISLGYTAVSDKVTEEKVKDLKVTNKDTEAKAYTVSWQNRHGEMSGPLTVKVPGKIEVKAGHSKKLTLDFAIEAAGLSDEAGLHELDGYVVLTDNNGEVTRIPYQAVVEKVSDVKAKAAKDLVKLQNKAATDSQTDLFEFGDLDRAEASIEDYQDLRAVGVRSEGGVTEFIATTEEAWDSPNLVEFNVYIDNNGDGNSEYILYNIDLGTFSGTDATGDQVSVLYNAAKESSTPLYYVDLGGSWNNAYMGLPVPNSLIAGENGEFNYQVVAWGQDSELPDGNEAGWISYNTQQPSLSFETNSLSVPAGKTEEVKVTVNESRAKALVINNAGAVESPYDVLKFIGNQNPGKPGKPGKPEKGK
ncbi:S8 family serine peptidase [Pseudalkalibacillus salsuginis]|uniref:S8 family serine peptidase n=1 Tax=Pseudalkalibacillus salsuginis TaxID=2910972 RepID=UPI001F20D12F|nr:S8 family serine peptidase [Pseudalkalibacillus salsuginis]MCF6411563.1 S8 family serine peptidase [Pseudalkalibacillus salsuginis]